MTDAQLHQLADACDAATFGFNEKDVLDESYRKAGKLDRSEFATGFDVHRNGLVDIVRNDLLNDEEVQGSIRAELYKLNVYGALQSVVNYSLAKHTGFRSWIVL